MTRSDLETAAAAAGLLVLGALPTDPSDGFDPPDGTLVLLGAGPDFWDVFRISAELQDGKPDPVDRWSARVVGDMASCLGATACFPFGGPPYRPFIAWAQRSGRAFPSPTGMLVHDRVGLMISFRGALKFDHDPGLPQVVGVPPCDTCENRPCLTACPVGALGEGVAYDVEACHAYLDTPDGADCMSNGCKARRACPVSAGAGRTSAQSELHMKAFHPS